jgi:hypothetical protein
VIFAPVSYAILKEKVQAPIGPRLFKKWPIAQIPPYVGALKAYLMAPVLGLFGGSPLTLRLPMILVGGLCVWLLGAFLFSRLGLFGATLAVALAATDPLFLFSTKIDWGPTTLAALFRCLAFGFFFRFLDTRAPRAMLWFLVATLLGTWDKSNFVWLSIALGLAALLVYPRELVAGLRATPGKTWAKIFVPIALGYVGLFIWIIAPSLRIGPSNQIHSLDALRDRFVFIWQIYATAANGAAIYSYALGGALPHAAIQAQLVPTQMALGFLLALPFPFLRRLPFRREIVFLTLVLTFLFLQVLVTPQAGGVHHMVVAWPLTQVQLVLLCLLPIELAPKGWLRRAARVAAALAVGCVIVSSVLTDGDYWTAMRANHATLPFRPEIADLAAKVRTLNVDKIAAVDWGTTHPMLALSVDKKERRKFEDSWPLFSDPIGDAQRIAWLHEHFFGDKPARVAFISYVYDFPQWPHNHTSRDQAFKAWTSCGTERYVVERRDTHEPLYRIDVLQSCPSAR